MKTIEKIEISESELKAIAKVAAQLAAEEAVKSVLEQRRATDWMKWKQEQLRKRAEWEKVHGRAVAPHLKIMEL